MEKIHVESIVLSKDSRTRNKLIPLFLLQKILANILETSENKLTKIVDAKLFLLTRINDLLPTLISHGRNQSIKAINTFVAQWISSRQAVSRLSFESGCGIKRDCSCVWLPRIDNITLANPSALLKKWDSKWVCYKPEFVLVDSPDGFIIEIPFVVKTAVKQSNIVESGKSNPQSNVSYNDFLRALEIHQMELDEVARAYSKTDFGKLGLGGWHTQGGLPSLGKKHR